VFVLEVLFTEVVVASEIAVGDGTRLLDPATAHEPARRLGQPEAGGEGDERDDARGEHPTPRQAAQLDQGVGQDHRDEVAAVPGDEHAREPPPAALGRCELREHRGADRVLGPDSDPQQEPDQQQLPRLGDHGLEQAEDDERPDVDREEGRPMRSASLPTSGEPKKIPTSVDAAMSPLQTGVRPRSVVISGRTTAMMPRSKPSRPSPIAVAHVIRRSIPMSRPATGGDAKPYGARPHARAETSARALVPLAGVQPRSIPRSTYCMIPPLR